MGRRRSLAALVATVGVLAACTYEPLVWTHRTSGIADYERDSAQCRHEAGREAGSYNAFVTVCMQSRGWYQVRPNALYREGSEPLPLAPVPRVRPAYALPLPPGEPSMPDLVAPPSVRLKGGGRWAYSAERTIAFYFPSCEAPSAYFKSGDARTEFFEVVCASGLSIEMQCDYAECAPS